jgi:raffinose/stachyose/melibiose transport system permease protein
MEKSLEKATLALLGNKSRWNRAHRFVPLPFLLPAVVIYAVFAVYPIISALVLSFYQWDGVSDQRAFVGLQNFIQVFTQDPVFWTSVKNSVVWVSLSLVVPALLGLSLAVALNRRLWGRTTLRAIFYLPSIIASIAVATMWSWMYNPTFGLVNAVLNALGASSAIQDWLGSPKVALFSIFVAYVWQSTGVAMVLFLAGLQGVPDDLKEAARVDGARSWQVFLNVTMPSLRETSIVVIVLTIINSLKVFDLIYGMTAGGPAQSTQVLALWSFTNSFGLHNYGTGNAIAMVLLAITLAIVIPYMIWTSREDEA